VIESLRRIYDNLCPKEAEDNYFKTIRRSFLISADMAHAIHPNYPDKHQTNHQVEMNKGVVIKTNHNQRYATDLVSTSLLRILAEQSNVPIQDFIVKNNSPCGSTIGPILASGTGIKTIDIGVPMLGMHSIRETCGVLDATHYYNLFKGFFDGFEKIKHDLLDQ
jgi:aspartyl aminopeptidase